MELFLETKVKIKYLPVRTCIGCGKKRDKSEMLRFVLSPEGEPVLDYLYKAVGRGVYLCPNKKCILEGIKPKVLKRGFKNTPLLSSLEDKEYRNKFIDLTVELLYKRVEELLRITLKAGKLEYGYERVKMLLEKSGIMVILSSDIPVRNENYIVNKCIEKGVEVHKIEKDKYWLGSVIGRSEVTVVGIKEKGLALKLSDTFMKIKGIQFS